MIKIKKIKFEKISEKEIYDWNLVLKNSSDATIFHTPEWINLVAVEDNLNCEVLFCYKDNKPAGVFPYYIKKEKVFLKKVTTSAFETPYGGPISIDTDRREILNALVIAHKKKYLFLSSNIVLPPDYQIDVFSRQSCIIRNKETLQVSIERSKEELWNNLHNMKRRNIKKALKNNITIKSTGIEYVRDFHSMLAATYNRLKLPPPKPINFYTNLFELLEPLERINLLMAFKDDKPIGAAIFLFFKDSIIYWQGASYEEYMKYAPNDLIHWNVIENGTKSGFKKYNMLHFHDSNGDEITSLKNYKLSFGTALHKYYHVEYKNRLFSVLKQFSKI